MHLILSIIHSFLTTHQSPRADCDCERISTQVPRLLLSVGSFVKPEVSECITSGEILSKVKQLTSLSPVLLVKEAVSLI